MPKAAPKGPRVPLEPNHSHFLFVDAGPEAEGQFGKEIELRAAVEDHFCRVPPPDMNGLNTSLQSVMILLVVAGGVGTLTTVLTILEKRRPVVVLPSSGGAAKDRDGLLNEIRALRDGGANGCIIGRNTFQRPREDALALLGEIIDIYRGKA